MIMFSLVIQNCENGNIFWQISIFRNLCGDNVKDKENQKSRSYITCYVRNAANICLVSENKKGQKQRTQNIQSITLLANRQLISNITNYNFKKLLNEKKRTIKKNEGIRIIQIVIYSFDQYCHQINRKLQCLTADITDFYSS